MSTLAIDPGSALGWASDASGRLEWGTVDFSIQRGESSGNRWRRFEQWLNSMTKYQYRTSESGLQVLRAGTIDRIVYERVTFQTPNRAYSDVLAGFYALLEVHAERYGIALQPVSVQELKAFALGKAPKRKSLGWIVGYKCGCSDGPKPKRELLRYCGVHGDNANEWHRDMPPKMDRSKEAMIAAAMFRIDRDLTLSHDLRKPSEHEADALWLYWWAKEKCK